MDNTNTIQNQNNIQQRQFHPIAGLWSGIGDMIGGNKYIPYITANWAGNGLAKTGIGYMVNPNYRDYVSAGQALGASNFKNLFSSSEKSNCASFERLILPFSRQISQLPNASCSRL